MAKGSARIFISHSSKDKGFTQKLASDLRQCGLDVWYDAWEIAVGDSIVEKVFDGLTASDTLVIVLSPASVISLWVREELNTAVMRRLSESDIRILPALIEPCDIPTSLRHIRYADFHENYAEGLADLVEGVAPSRALWDSLSHLYEYLCMLCDQIATSDLNSDAHEKILNLHSLLESALNLRTEVEFRKARQRIRNLSFFEKIGVLADKGIDIRSQTWKAVVHFRARLAHNMEMRRVNLAVFAEGLRERYPDRDLQATLVAGMDRLKQVMHTICFEQWANDEHDSPQ